MTRSPAGGDSDLYLLDDQDEQGDKLWRKNKT
jgi:hypothetical protein